MLTIQSQWEQMAQHRSVHTGFLVQCKLGRHHAWQRKHQRLISHDLPTEADPTSCSHIMVAVQEFGNRRFGDGNVYVTFILLIKHQQPFITLEHVTLQETMAAAAGAAAAPLQGVMALMHCLQICGLEMNQQNVVTAEGLQDLMLCRCYSTDKDLLAGDG